MINIENADFGEGEDFTTKFTTRIISQIVKEQDEYTLNIIEEYIKAAQARGECVNANIIPEGKLRHIINLGLTLYAEQKHLKLNPHGLFPETAYVEYLRKENDELRKLLSRKLSEEDEEQI